MAIEPQWTDYNGHMNMAYYNVLFDRCVDQACDLLGIGAAYAKTRRLTIYTAEVHVCYVRELHQHHSVTVSLQLLDHDAEAASPLPGSAPRGWLAAATSELLVLHIDMSGPKVAPFPEDILPNVEDMARAHTDLPAPERAGRRIGIERRT